MLDFATRFSSGLTYDDFLARYGTADQQQRWLNYYNSIKLTQAQRQLLAGFTRQMHVLCMAGAWCGDCVQQCPIFKHFEEAAPAISLRFVDRDADEELRAKMTICGGARVPQVVFLSEDDKPLGWYGDRTLAKYRAMAQAQVGDSCATGIAGTGPQKLDMAVTQDWLDEFERNQLILRLSPRLRKKHGD